VSFWNSALHHNNKKKLFLLHEGTPQIRDNSFITQLYEVLDSTFDVCPISRRRLLIGRKRFKTDDLVLSVLKLRSWQKLIPCLARAVEKSGIHFYDQDPWDAYHDYASAPGAYKEVASSMNVKSFLVTSLWWANYIKDTDNLPVKFVRMGILPRLCDVGLAYEKRPIEVGFQGTLHKHRKDFYDRMDQLGVKTEFVPSVPYGEFLKTIQNIQIYLHDERRHVPMNGLECGHWIWVKEVEAAARGCFSIRNYDEEANAYGIDELPTILPFKDEAEVPSIIEYIRSLSLAEKNERMRTSVEAVKTRNDWMTVINALLS
jgi:hypothetical protein